VFIADGMSVCFSIGEKDGDKIETRWSPLISLEALELALA
jgi:hypothetical protein